MVVSINIKSYKMRHLKLQITLEQIYALILILAITEEMYTFLF